MYLPGPKLWLVALAVFLINIPFGYWRGKHKRFSRQWMFAIHLPVPLVIGLRIFSGLGWQLISFPVLIGAFFLGQFCGGKVSSLNAQSHERLAE